MHDHHTLLAFVLRVQASTCALHALHYHRACVPMTYTLTACRRLSTHECVNALYGIDAHATRDIHLSAVWTTCPFRPYDIYQSTLNASSNPLTGRTDRFRIITPAPYERRRKHLMEYASGWLIRAANIKSKNVVVAVGVPVRARVMCMRACMDAYVREIDECMYAGK